MLKYLLLALVLIWLVYSPGIRRLLRGHDAPRPSAQRPPEASPHAESMVRCAHCGVHLPASEALTGPQGHAYCSAAHRDAGPQHR